MSEDFLTQWNDYNGYKWTWEASGSKDNVTIKAEAKDDFPAFYAAAHYNSGVPVTGTNIGKWFLPAFGQWKLLLVRLCGLDADAITTWGPYAWGPYPLFKKPLDAAFDNIFTQAGGVTLRDDWCWSSSERNITNSNDVTIRTNHVETEEQGYGKDAGEVVRSFVHF